VSQSKTPSVKEHLASFDDTLQAQDRPLAGQRQVFDLAELVWAATDEPDGLCASQLGHHDPASEPFVQGSAALTRLGPAQQAQVLGDT